jgi:hypothetical protein
VLNKPYILWNDLQALAIDGGNGLPRWGTVDNLYEKLLERRSFLQGGLITPARGFLYLY